MGGDKGRSDLQAWKDGQMVCVACISCVCLGIECVSVVCMCMCGMCIVEVRSMVSVKGECSMWCV